MQGSPTKRTVELSRKIDGEGAGAKRGGYRRTLANGSIKFMGALRWFQTPARGTNVERSSPPIQRHLHVEDVHEATIGLREQKGRTITTYIAREARRPNLRINHSRGNEKTKRTFTKKKKKRVAKIVKKTTTPVIRRRRGRSRKAKAKMDFSGRIVRSTMKGKSPSV
ncbi:hypothetical protein ALC62_11736 [Cyphomyrmex costatus]|uniref:Uncharacterized protein n=1 Tax=Cyphomyrmex costatus TaxID=456900 RepID=A0A195C9A3_9HYME|nr:hypothetical protein ALC62_11736 [Cyphomyrmex costatus]